MSRERPARIKVPREFLVFVDAAVERQIERGVDVIIELGHETLVLPGTEASAYLAYSLGGDSPACARRQVDALVK